MKTLIVKENGNEEVSAELKFRVIRSTVSKYRKDQLVFDSYSKVKDRMDGLKKIFKANEWKWEIVIQEG